MKLQHIIGADLSKKSIDLVCHPVNHHLCIENAAAGFTLLLEWLKQLQISPSQLMIVMEHTGLYSYCFENFLQQHSIAFTKVNALAIKRSLGIIRGKSDKIDATRIAAYGFEKRDKLRPQPLCNEKLQRLQMLNSTRDKMVKQRASLICTVKEYRHIGIGPGDIILKSQLQLVKTYDNHIAKVEAEIQRLIDEQPAIRQNYQLLQSIKGVGKVLALTAILKTGNFTRFENPRKFACFCGTAPFEHRSGTSYRGKTRVSHLADKQMKTLLDLSSKTAIQYDKELRAFYLRRTENGKSKMSTINIVRNKILFRMFAVIKRQTPFIENYSPAA